MILIAAIALLVVSVVFLGGDLGSLAGLRLRHTWLIVFAFAVQLSVISVFPHVGEGVGRAVHLVSYLVAAAFVVANRRLPGMRLLALGGGLNLIAIFANGGVMPASAWAVRVAGRSIRAGEFANSRSVGSPRVPVLGDVFAIPRGWPFANVFSIGDLLLVAGAAVALHVICQSRPARRRSHPGRHPGGQPMVSIGADS